MCDRFPRKFDVQTSSKPSYYVLRLMFVVSIKFPPATYHTIVPSTEELYCLNRANAASSRSFNLFIYLFIYLSIYLFIYLLIYLFIYLFI